ncbi:MAG: hypothetical protein JWM16_2872 [Verrucomicrobiales bacterium]|nr:hypothetical protein [Verrucomicrobiales bacterium]
MVVNTVVKPYGLGMRTIVIIIVSLCLILSLASCKSSGSAKAQQDEFLLRVDGEVQNPGMYSFRDGDTIQVVVARAGGLYKWPPDSGTLTAPSATVTSGDGAKRVVKRKDWGHHRIKVGDKVYLNRSFF